MSLRDRAGSAALCFCDCHSDLPLFGSLSEKFQVAGSSIDDQLVCKELLLIQPLGVAVRLGAEAPLPLGKGNRLALDTLAQFCTQAIARHQVEADVEEVFQRISPTEDINLNKSHVHPLWGLGAHLCFGKADRWEVYIG